MSERYKDKLLSKSVQNTLLHFVKTDTFGVTQIYQFRYSLKSEVI